MKSLKQTIRKWLEIDKDYIRLVNDIETINTRLSENKPESGGFAIEATQQAIYEPEPTGSVVVVEPMELTKFRAGQL